jgi:hypothetical protein
MSDRTFRIVENFALASDGTQWIVQRRKGDNLWRSVSFVRTRKDILGRCLREAGASERITEQLLASLPADFDTWLEMTASPSRQAA